MDRFFPILLIVLLPILATLGWLVGSATGWPVPAYGYIFITQFITIGLVAYALQQARLASLGVTSEYLDELQKAYIQFGTLYRSSPVPYLTIDAGGFIKSYNLAAVNLFDTNTTELVGGRLSDYLIGTAGVDKLGVIFGKLQQHSPILDEEVEIETATGRRRWVRFSVFSHDNAEVRLAALVDITAQKRVDTAKSEFVALATHQLRTPIAAIRWNLELMERKLRDVPPDTYGSYMKKVKRNVERMVALISDFLSVSKLETGTFAANKERIELPAYLDDIADEFASELTNKHIELKTTTEPDDLVITADSRLFHIVTSNLLSNAVKYTPAEGTIDWGYQVADRELVFWVRDSGIGIPASEQAHLFEKFFRATNAQQHKAEGTGLGLYIVSQSVEQLGGSISFASVENEGTTFTIRLPL